MKRDPLTVLEEMGATIASSYEGIYLSITADGRYFCEDVAGDSLADLREAAARLLATVENPSPLPPPPEPVYPSSPIAYQTDDGWQIDVGYSQEGVFTLLGMTLEYRRRAHGCYTVRRLDGPLPSAFTTGFKLTSLEAGHSDWLDQPEMEGE